MTDKTYSMTIEGKHLMLGQSKNKGNNIVEFGLDDCSLTKDSKTILIKAKGRKDGTLFTFNVTYDMFNKVTDIKPIKKKKLIDADYKNI